MTVEEMIRSLQELDNPDAQVVFRHGGSNSRVYHIDGITNEGMTQVLETGAWEHVDTGDTAEATWHDFWRPILEKDGVLDLELVKLELDDYHRFLDDVARVYVHATGGRISKQNSRAEAVIAVINEHLGGLIEEGIEEALENGREEVMEDIKFELKWPAEGRES